MLEFAEWLQTTPISVVIQSTTWVIPLLQSIHILMIGVVFVSILMVVLRVLGRVRTDETLGTVWTRFAPWMWSALVVMALTGLTLVIGEPVREFSALSFWLKMGLIAIGVASVLVFRRSLDSGAARRAAGARVLCRDEVRGDSHPRAVARDHLPRPRNRLRRRVWGSLSLSS